MMGQISYAVANFSSYSCRKLPILDVIHQYSCDNDKNGETANSMEDRFLWSEEEQNPVIMIVLTGFPPSFLGRFP